MIGAKICKGKIMWEILYSNGDAPSGHLGRGQVRHRGPKGALREPGQRGRRDTETFLRC